MNELMKSRDEVQGEINRRASEIAERQIEEEEKKRRAYEETESLFAAWLPKHYESGTESDSEADSSEGYEYHVEEEGEPKVEEKLVLIHPRTAQEKYSIDSDENLHDASNDDEEDDEIDEEDSSSGDSDTSPASSGSSCSERYSEDED
ncbi:ribosomal L1 domain-containing protein CG13096-like [Papaver somniferum]|uniref:ribosomal L1 domain-containing protein CG13096-like n=1 Tax=Papaver somniferum TaxID=3469 RepID=UPI000E6F795E|nr:ribosomal L1 domain-containing protein CG13096-like [Papaver somniferum]